MAKIVLRVIEIALLAIALRLVIQAVIYNADQRRLERTDRVTLPANTEKELGFKPHYGKGYKLE